MRDGSRHGIVALSLVALCLVLGGCGSSSSASSEPLSKAQYVEQGNKVCKEGVAEKDQAVKKGLQETPRDEFPKLSQETLKRLGEDALPSFQKIVTELTELTPPAKDSATIEKITAELEGALAKTEAEPVLLAKGDPFRKSGAALRAYGLENCAL